MRPLQPRIPFRAAIFSIALLATPYIAARTFLRIFDAPPDKVYSAALRAAETDGRITIIDENAKQRRMHLRVNVQTADISQPPSMPPMGTGSSAQGQEQWGGILLTLIVTPSGPLQSSVSIETQSIGPGLPTGPYPGRFPGDRRNAQEFQEKRAACTMLVRMRSILKLPNRKIGDVVSLNECD